MQPRAEVLGHSGDTSVSWSIVLHAELTVAADPTEVAQRLAAVADEHPHLGPAPTVVPTTQAELPELRDAFAAQPYAPGDALVRVAVGTNASFVLLAAHHSALDGLGLLVLLGGALDISVASSVTGLGPERAGRPFVVAAASRVAEALFRPAGRVAPSVTNGPAGEILAAASVPSMRLGTADLVSAVARATAAWNTARGAAPGPIMAAVGASRRGGAAARLADDSAYLRIPVAPPGEPAQVATAMAAAAPEPAVPTSAGLLARAVPAALSARLGSTFLASNLGRVEAGEVHTLAFYPVTGGRSGVAFGAVTVAGTTTVTVRARRRDFDSAAAEALLDGVIGRVRAGAA